MDGLLPESSELAKGRPDLIFEEGIFSLPDILDSHLLPLVVQYDCGGQPAPFNKFAFDLTQPLLLYKKRNIQKVAATSLHIQDNKYEDLGESLLIPEDYKGWFAVLQRITGNIKADDTVPYFSSVEELANSNTEKFLIGGTKKISGLQILDRSEGQIKHEQRHFLPGDTLTAEKVEFGETKKRTRLFRKPKYIREKFLMCTDESDRDILLPFEQQGIFYQVSHKSGKPNKNVMQMSDIVARKLTPRIIKLVFGRFPVTPCAFTGLMKAESSRIETSVIASTLINQQNILMEIPVSNEIYFKIAVTNDDLRQNSCYRNAMHFCAERGSTYMRNIKICYNFTLCGGFTNESICSPPPGKCNTVDSYVEADGINAEDQNDATKGININTKIPTLNVRHSEVSVNDVVSGTIIPGRCISTGRMSFCLGNSYLTVPMYDPTKAEKRNSGNNNTETEMLLTTRRGSRISFNGKFLEMEEGAEAGGEQESPLTSEEYPPPMTCTNISSYVNMIQPPKVETNPEFPDYIPTSMSRRPSSLPPESAPPPIPPLSSSTSGVSSGSMSSVSDEANSKRASSESFEYDVPKADSNSNCAASISRSIVTNNESSSTDNASVKRMRRPSTYTFAEGCLNMTRSRTSMHGELMEELDESACETDSPIYENIQSLIEIAKPFDRKSKEIRENFDSYSVEKQSTFDEKLTCTPSETSVTENDSSIATTLDISTEAQVDPYTQSSYVSQSNGTGSIVQRRGFKLSVTGARLPSPTNTSPTLSASSKSLSLEMLQNKEDSTGVTHDQNDTSEIENNEILSYIEQNKTKDDGNTGAEYNKCVKALSSSEQNNEMYFETVNDRVPDRNMGDNYLTEMKEDSVDNDGYEPFTEKDRFHDDSEKTNVVEEKEKSHIHAGDREHSSFPNENENFVDENTFSDNESKILHHDTEKSALFEDCQNVNSIVSRGSGITLDEVKLSGQVSEKNSGCVDTETCEMKQDWKDALINLRRTRSLKGDSQSNDGVTEQAFPSDPEQLSRLSSMEVREHFKAVGIRETTLNQIMELNINGAVLTDVLSGEKTIRESMAGVNLVDQQKISMYIRGWRPQYE